MSTKPIFPCALLLALTGVGSLLAQDASIPPGPPPGVQRNANLTATNEVPPPTESHPPAQPDKWITYCCPDCCGPIGHDGPIKYELFVRSGAVLPVAGGATYGTVVGGWTVEGGVRSLFVEPDPAFAWALEVGVGHTFNDGKRNNPRYITKTSQDFIDRVTAAGGTAPPPLSLVSTADIQRTDVTACFGREWWLLGTACSDGYKWRTGLDVGFRYGSTRLDIHDFNPPSGVGFGNYQRTSSVDYGPVVALHTDFEYPCGCCTFLAGARFEWDYLRMNVIPLLDNDIYNVNILLNFGVRY